MRILFYLHFYYPEVGAASLRAQYFVNALEEAGHIVTIITPKPNYPAGKVYKGFEKKPWKTIKRKNVIYLPIFSPKKQSLITRIISYATYFIVSLVYTFLLKKNYDLIISSSPPMSTALSAVLFSKYKNKELILDVRDLWPDIGVELKIIENKYIIRLLKQLDRFILNNVNHIIAPLANFKDRLLIKNEKLKITTIFNGADTNIFKPLSSEEKRNKIRQHYNLPLDKKIFIYFGFFNFGMNDVDTLATSLTKLDSNNSDIYFLFIGGGAKKGEFIEKIKHHIEFSFFESMGPSEIAKILPACDLSLIPLKKIDKNTGGFIPVKCLESWSAGLPVLLASSGDKEIELIFQESKGGFIIPAGNSDALTAKMIEICNMENLRELGISAREYVIRNFDRKTESRKILGILEEI